MLECGLIDEKEIPKVQKRIADHKMCADGPLRLGDESCTWPNGSTEGKQLPRPHCGCSRVSHFTLIASPRAPRCVFYRGKKAGPTPAKTPASNGRASAAKV